MRISSSPDAAVRPSSTEVCQLHPARSSVAAVGCVLTQSISRPHSSRLVTISPRSPYPNQPSVLTIGHWILRKIHAEGLYRVAAKPSCSNTSSMTPSLMDKRPLSSPLSGEGATDECSSIATKQSRPAKRTKLTVYCCCQG